MMSRKECTHPSATQATTYWRRADRERHTHRHTHTPTHRHTQTHTHTETQRHRDTERRGSSVQVLGSQCGHLPVCNPARTDAVMGTARGRLPLLLLLVGLAFLKGVASQVNCNDVGICTSGYNPLCASNLHTYGNQCEMLIDKCQRSLSDLAQLHDGPCKICSTISGSCRCPSDLTNTAQYRCSNIMKPVCGTDFVTYNNECLLNLASLCRPEAMIDRGMPGECPPIRCGIPCSPLNEPVCGSDRLNYTSGCELEYAKMCTPGLSNLVRRHSGFCECEADSNCPTDRDPVCTTEGVTYTNRCYLNVEALCYGRVSTIRHLGVCRCGADYNCPTVLDPVCGTNGVTYDNECLLNLDKLCAPALMVASPGPCTCNVACDPQENSPVCGSDLNTYSSVCYFNAANCNSGYNLAVLHTGPCTCVRNYSCHGSAFNPKCGTDGVTYNSDCFLRVAKLCNPNLGVAYTGPCRCNMTCPPTMNTNEVCGSDFTTYLTECHLNMANCNAGLSLTVLHTGPCLCDNGYFCSSEHRPVCGTDGQTYTNECFFQKARLCNPGISVAYIGPCRCNTECPPSYSPVCASNFETYDNLCLLNQANCLSTHNLTVLNDGPCTCAMNYRCNMPPQHVCGTDGITYDNECLLQVANLCTPGVRIEVDYIGRCNENCQFHCTVGYSDWPVCGSDFKTYRSRCFMDAAICRSSDNLQMLYEGPCQCPRGPFCSDVYVPVCSTLGIYFTNECFLNVYNLCRDSTVRRHFESYCRLRGIPPPGNQAAALSASWWGWIAVTSLATWRTI